MESKYFLKAALLFYIVFSLISWYSGINEISVHKSEFKDKVTFEQAEKIMGKTIDPTKQYFYDNKLIKQSTRSKIPFVYNKKVLSHKVQFMSREI